MNAGQSGNQTENAIQDPNNEQAPLPQTTFAQLFTQYFLLPDKIPVLVLYPPLPVNFKLFAGL
jgi:hypothetical protein